MFYSPSTRGFYDPVFHSENLPLDCVELSEDQYAGLLADQARGLQIVPNENGLPIAVPPEISLESLKKADRQNALSELVVTDSVALRCFKDGVKFPVEWKNYTVFLREFINGESEIAPERPPYP